ncbi:hypothetical protein SDJN02_11283 [Cucurbita argyrosperma subsp. argyrosperma]|nr:hypothetical protein SDJN02_11283 [Cucurbita argyrosperma subsp. argyrosperma]
MLRRGLKVGGEAEQWQRDGICVPRRTCRFVFQILSDSHLRNRTVSHPFTSGSKMSIMLKKAEEHYLLVAHI